MGYTMQILFSALMIAGTCIGGGMLALPISSARFGFIPTMIIMLLAWFFMTLGGVYYVDITVKSPKGSHLLSIGKRYLGVTGQAVYWVTYILIGYTSFIAYLSEGSQLLSEGVFSLYQLSLSPLLSCMIYASLFLGMLALGHIKLSRVNGLLFAVMVLSFLGLIVQIIPRVEFTHLVQSKDNLNSFRLFPLMLCIFSFPGVVPGVVRLVDYNASHARLAVIFGTSIAMIFYVLWIFAVIGNFPIEELQELYRMDRSVALILSEQANSPRLLVFSQLFSFLAITTSFIGVGWAFFDFLLDAFFPSTKKASLRGCITVAGIMVAPAMLFSLTSERIFYTALELSGGFGDSLVSGILPACILWVIQGQKGQHSSFIHKFGIISMLVFFGSILLMELIGLTQN